MPMNFSFIKAIENSCEKKLSNYAIAKFESTG